MARLHEKNGRLYATKLTLGELIEFFYALNPKERAERLVQELFNSGILLLDRQRVLVYD